jgi:hypothetical protein
MATFFILLSAMIIPLSSASFETVLKSSEEKIQMNTPIAAGGGSFASHHKVLGELGTATWCGYCPSASYYIQQVAGDFQYVSLVADKSGAANFRCIELGLGGYPTAFFDGGFREVVGGQSSSSNYQNAYNICQGRDVGDIEITIFCIWNLDDTMKFTVIIDNLGSSVYNGHLHVYVCEKTSRWNDADGDPYKNALLGYAMNKDFTVSPGSDWTDTTSGWSWTDIERDNILIVATVFEQGSMYVDDTATTTPSDPGGGGGGGNTPVPILKISTPGQEETVKETVEISGTAHHPEGDGKLKWVLVKIDEEDWEQADGTVYWSYMWNTESVEDGLHTISAVCSDGQKSSAIYDTTVIVQNNEPEPPPPERDPDLECYGTMSWNEVTPESEVTGQFTIENKGDSQSQLNWSIDETPQWGEWMFDPSEGTGLTPEDGPVIVNVNVVAPEEPNWDLEGEIKIVNTDNNSDFNTIQVSLSTPKSRVYQFYMMIQDFLDDHPYLFPVLRYLLKL